ncbi:DUF3519 domain-containing protein [Helicobacter pylori]|uniref:DUF3519 domain-containing protein n=1 Tax=Helicobacter pylori TaxID=210 RepID=UPI0006809037|nr:DUF3519 domain-containing protein [Helicobacter pylori]KMZ51185.1 hypothetical protein AC785_03715 [Helicobacter pylori]
MATLLNEATAGAALKYHIKRALERSHTISDFSKNLELSAKNAKFSNNTLKIIEELNNGVKQASEEIKEATKTSNLVKSIREQDTRPFEVVEAKDKEAFLQGIEEKLKDSATPLPKGMSVAEFKQSLESVENKDRFLEHLETRDNSQDRLKFLSLIEPILREPHIEIFIKDKDGTLKKEYIKAFKDENNTRLYMLITQDNDTILRTFIPKLNERHMRSHVRDADIIHSFIQPNRTAKSDNALSDVVVYGENNTPKPLNSQEDLLKTSENLNETPPKPTHLSPLEQANAKNLLKEQRATTPLKEFGTNYPEFALKPKEALEKLLQEKNGQVAGAAYREDLGGIDFVWGTPKTKDSNGYGLAHILEKREKQCKRLGLTNEQAKERTKELLKQIPEVIEKGIKDNDYIGHATIRHNGIEVGLSSQKGNTPLKNHYMITSFETDEKVLRELETIGTLSNNYRDGINYSTSNLNNPNPTTNALKTQEPLSEQANAKKLLKLESEKGIKAEVLKKLDFDEIKKLIDESPRTGSSMPILGMQNLNAEAVEYIQKNHKRIAVEKIEPSFAKDLKLKYPDDVRAVIDYQAINHILKEHKNLAFEDIANYRELSKQANETLKLKDNQNRPVVASFNQINGFFVVVDQVSNAKNELMLKTMYKARENYKDSLIYKKTLAKSQNSN